MIQWHLGAGHGKRQEGSTPRRFIVSWFQGCQDRTELSYLSFQFASVSTSNPSLLLFLLDLALCDRPRHAPNFDQPRALELDHSTDPRNIPVDSHPPLPPPLGSPDPLVVLLLIHPLDGLLGAFHQLSQGHLQVLEKRRRAWFFELLIVMMIICTVYLDLCTYMYMYIYVHVL